MANTKMVPCAACGKEISGTAKVCPHCGAKNRKPVYKRPWLWVIIALILIIAVSGGEEEKPPVGDNSTMSATSSVQNTEDVFQITTQTTEAPADVAYQVGAVVEVNGLKITYVSCYENPRQAPDGYRYITCEFEVVNISDYDKGLSSWDFACYADDILCDESLFTEGNSITATLSSGRKTQGTLTYVVPRSAAVVELEYETNAWTSEKIIFSANPQF